MIEDLIRRARRRFLLNETLAAICVRLGSLRWRIVMMLEIFGTRYLEWWTLGIFAAAGLAIGVYRVYQRTPGEYSTAVRLDENGASARRTFDRSAFFRTHWSGIAAHSENFQQSQRKQAEGSAGGVQLEQARSVSDPAFALCDGGVMPCLLPRACRVALRASAMALICARRSRSFCSKTSPFRDAKKAQALYPKIENMDDEAQSLLSKLGLGHKSE